MIGKLVRTYMYPSTSIHINGGNKKMLRLHNHNFKCEMELTVYLISGKWKIPIIWNLKEGTMRFAEIKRQLGSVTPKMLTQQLRELEEASLVKRLIYAEMPPRVEYSLTEDAISILPILKQLSQWGNNYYNKNKTN
jgi:DNA-binding HxlR family transcriptional regulator